MFAAPAPPPAPRQFVHAHAVVRRAEREAAGARPAQRGDAHGVVRALVRQRVSAHACMHARGGGQEGETMHSCRGCSVWRPGQLHAPA